MKRNAFFESLIEKRENAPANANPLFSGGRQRVLNDGQEYAINNYVTNRARSDDDEGLFEIYYNTNEAVDLYIRDEIDTIRAAGYSTVIVTGTDNPLHLIGQLKDLGCRIGDFGTAEHGGSARLGIKVYL